MSAGSNSSPRFTKNVKSKSAAISQQLLTEFCFLRALENAELNRVTCVQQLLSSKSTCFKQSVVAKLFEDVGVGLVATQPITKEACVIRVPRSYMLDAHNGCSKSFKSLVSNYQSICRQYAYFFNHIRDSGFPVAGAFCFEDYRWAVSTVMSRNNLIPRSDSSKGAPDLCLVPLWDLINHKSGKLTTDFDPTSSELVFYSMESICPGEQICMDYGKRTNTEFLLFSGFVPDSNPHNHITITLGVSTADALGAKRCRLLEMIGLQSPLIRNVAQEISELDDLVAFARVFVMNEEQLDSYLSRMRYSMEEIRLSSVSYTQPVDCKAVEFLMKRFELLIAAYGPLMAENHPDFLELSPIERGCEQLRLQEVVILQSAIKHLQAIPTSPVAEVLSNNFRVGCSMFPGCEPPVVGT